MPLKFFHVPSRDSTKAEEEMLSFLSRHRVVTIDRRFVEDGQNSFWALCVDYLHGEATHGGAAHGAPGRSERKVDYKEVLSPEQFARYAKLRELRKQVAEREAVPVYAVFTNEQLAEMVRMSADSRAKLRSIEGIGDAKVEKYGDAFLAALTASSSPPPSCNVSGVFTMRYGNGTICRRPSTRHVAPREKAAPRTHLKRPLKKI